MKRLFLLIIILFIGVLSYSQVRLGINVGYNSLSIKSDSFELQKPGSGFDIGVSYKYLFSDSFTILVETGYFKTKLDFGGQSFFDDINFSEIDTEKDLKGFSYSFLGNYNFQENIGVLFGPSGQFYFNKLRNDNTVYSPDYSLGLTAGVIGTFDNFTIDARYTYGLNKPFELDIDEDFIEGTHNIFSIRLTYYFYDLKLAY